MSKEKLGISMKKISLTQGKMALVDDGDYEALSKMKWHAVRTATGFYASTWIIGKGQCFMHRMIMKTPKGMHTDHVNGNGLDNQRKNLRICDNSFNQLNRTKLNKNNSSGLTGIVLEKRTGKWKAVIQKNGKKIHIGTFTSKCKAHEARKKVLSSLIK